MTTDLDYSVVNKGIGIVRKYEPGALVGMGTGKFWVSCRPDVLSELSAEDRQTLESDGWVWSVDEKLIDEDYPSGATWTIQTPKELTERYWEDRAVGSRVDAAQRAIVRTKDEYIALYDIIAKHKIAYTLSIFGDVSAEAEAELRALGFIVMTYRTTTIVSESWSMEKVVGDQEDALRKGQN